METSPHHTCVNVSETASYCTKVTMLYIYIVLLSTALATIIVYLLQLHFSLWGRKKRKVGRNAEMRKNAEKEKGLSGNEKKEREIRDLKPINKDDPSVEKDEKLTIKIITNKEPIIEKISPTEEEDKKVIKPLNFCQFLQKKRNAKKVQVNIPFSEWKGKVSCKIFKKVDFQSHAKTQSQRGKFFFNHSCLD